MNYSIGDKVSYCGSKFASDLGGKMGEICNRVINQEDHYVVAFGDGDYIMPTSSLTRFQGNTKTTSDSAPEKGRKPKEPRVEQRRKGGRQAEESDTE